MSNKSWFLLFFIGILASLLLLAATPIKTDVPFSDRSKVTDIYTIEKEGTIEAQGAGLRKEKKR